MGYIKLEIDKINKNNDINFLEDDLKKRNSLKNFIKKYGQIKNLIVYEQDKKYYLLSDYYYFECLKELKIKTVSVFNVGEMDLDEATLVALGLINSFDLDYIQMAKQIKKILNTYDGEQISALTHMEKREIEVFPRLLDFDFKRYDTNKHHELYTESEQEYF